MKAEKHEIKFSLKMKNAKNLLVNIVKAQNSDL